jgi:D-alanine-D-alanine ligase
MTTKSVAKNILLFGGNSDERFVSVASAQNLAGIMKEKSSTPFSELWFIAPDESVARVDYGFLQNHADPFKSAFRPPSKPFAKSMESALRSPEFTPAEPPTFFLGLHGTFGEDGKLQALLEKHSIPFTGSGSRSSHMCFDKTVAKKVVSEKAVETAEGILLDASDFEAKLTEFFKKHGKIVAKPVSNGSSIGLHIISDEAGLKRAIEDIRKQSAYGTFMSEQFIDGRELTVGVIDRGGTLMPLPPSEVVLNPGASFDYDGKYLGRGTTEITPAKITDEECEKAQTLALHAHRSLGCYGYSRTDLVLQKNRVVMIETNTLPGLTKASFIPQQLHAAGIEVASFIESQQILARRRDFSR